MKKAISMFMMAISSLLALQGCDTSSQITATEILTYNKKLANDPRRGGSTRLDIEINRWMYSKLLPVAQCLIGGGCASLPQDRISKEIRAKLFTKENTRDLKNALTSYFHSTQYRWLGSQITVSWEDAESCSGDAWLVGGGSQHFKDRRNFSVSFPGHDKKLFIDIECSYVEHGSACGSLESRIGSAIAGCLWHRDLQLQEYCDVRQVVFH